MTDANANDFVEWREEGHVAILVLRDEVSRNSLSPSMIDAVCAGLDRVDDTRHIRCAVLTGSGSAFCSGGNPKRMLEPVYTQATTDEITRQYARTFHRIPLKLRGLTKPVVAGINGHAIGAGLDLACYCDVRVAAEEAKFASSFVKLGLVPGDGGAWILPRIVGSARAAELMLTGAAIDAREARAIGLVTHVVPRAGVLTRAVELAQAIAANPPHATRMIKQLQRASEDLALPEALSIAAQMQAVAHKVPDHKEAVRAGLENRTPNYSGDQEL